MIAELFTTFIYQPFFNILVLFYWLLGLFTQGQPDMGIAVILLTILIRILLLPLSLAGDKSEAERRQIGKKIKELEETFAGDPIAFRQHKKMVLRQSRGVVIGEIVSLAVQVAISLMLWRIFARGLEGEDLHLLYSFMPEVEEPFNLVFLGRFDLAHSSVFLNVLQSLCIFVLETLSIYTSPYPPEKGEVVRLQLVLPVVSFFVFMLLPAGKKLFIITTLIISILLTLYKFAKHRFEAYKLKKEEAEAALAEGQQKLVVDMK
jgi:membrane protein insertase Oxa1/YidC/SpoIIIJ